MGGRPSTPPPSTSPSSKSWAIRPPTPSTFLQPAPLKLWYAVRCCLPSACVTHHTHALWVGCLCFNQDMIKILLSRKPSDRFGEADVSAPAAAIDYAALKVGVALLVGLLWQLQGNHTVVASCGILHHRLIPSGAASFVTPSRLRRPTSRHQPQSSAWWMASMSTGRCMAKQLY